MCFFVGGTLMWMPVVEILPGPAWFGTGDKLGYIVVVRLVETVLANVFFWSGHVFYGSTSTRGGRGASRRSTTRGSRARS